MLRISAYSSRELQAVIVGLKSADRDLRKRIRSETKQMIDPVWRKTLAEHSLTRLENKVLVSTARVQVSDQNVTLKVAQVGRPLSGGLSPKTQWYAAEFGAARPSWTRYTARSRKGTSFEVLRRTTNQLRPRRQSGYVVYPAAAEVIPRLASLWVQTAMRMLHEAFEAR